MSASGSWVGWDKRSRRIETAEVSGELVALLTATATL
jgi:hypothetical protein